MRLRGARKDVHGGGLRCNRRGIDPGLGLLDGVVVEQVTGFKVVGAVEEEVRAFQQRVDVSGDEVGDAREDLDVGVAAAASASSKRICRWRFENSTISRSIRVRWPTPARARMEAEAAPVAPTPMIATRESASLCWPSRPMPGKRIWRE